MADSLKNREHLMQQIRTILLNQYIGAIAIGYLIGRGFETLFGSFMPAFNTKLVLVLGSGTYGEDLWTNARVAFISNLVLASIYFFTALLLALWLYGESSNNTKELHGAE